MDEKMRIVQELVPGKQVSIAHVIANPDAGLYSAMKLAENTSGAIGIVTVCPSETAIIAGDVAVKAAGVKISHVDYTENGTLIVTGSVSEVQSALSAILDFCKNKLGFEVCGITKT